MSKEIIWKESKEGTLEGYLGETMFFDINKEEGRFAVYEMKKSTKNAMNRRDFETLDIAKRYCVRLCQ